jgi:two-component SAPR family response regulator
MKVILVDDEQLALDYLERQLLKIKDIIIIAKFTNPHEALEGITQCVPDVVFLDIQLPEMSGIELANLLFERNPNLNIVFVTAYNEFAVKAFEINALDYIVKPVRMERLIKTMGRMKEYQHEAPSMVEEGTEELRLHVFRQVTLKKAKEPPVILQWRTSKAQELFLYLLQHRGQLVRKSSLIDLLWPEHELTKVYSQLYTAIYHIRKTLSPYTGHFQITNMTEGYCLELKDVTVDVDEWEYFKSQDIPLSPTTLDNYIKMEKLYVGDYLQEYDYWWAEGERERLKKQWLETAYKIANWYMESGNEDKAIEYYNKICTSNPLEEYANYALMRLYASKGQYHLVTRQFEQFKKILFEDLEEEPSLYITEWYEKWENSAV